LLAVLLLLPAPGWTVLAMQMSLQDDP
jgi:hypothetical protein